MACRHRQRSQVAAHFQQAAAAVPAVALVAACPTGHLDQRAPVQPHVGIIEPGVVAVQRRIALFVALQIDLDVVRFHRHGHADRAGHVDLRAIAYKRARARLDRDLAARRQRQRIALEVDRAAAVDLHQRQVAPIAVGKRQRGGSR
ncbi:hypothetical protein G6F66_014600 [Rhizopus arrhizus]|nr:hypothetical protein G6F66_014600 [Rhizopus arrhizus]